MHIRVPRHSPSPQLASPRLGRLRTRAVGAAALAAAGAALLAVESVILAHGDGSPQPEGSADGTFGDGAGKPLHVVVLGDSAGAAVGAGDVHLGYPSLVCAMLAEELGCPVDLTVLAVSGARVADVRARQLPMLEALRPDIVLIVVGGNDATHRTDRGNARYDLRSTIFAAKQTGARVLVSGVPAMGILRKAPQPLRMILGGIGRRYDDIWRDETAAAGVARIELAEHTRRPFAADRALLSEDGFHPSAAGYAVWASVIGPPVLAEAQILRGELQDTRDRPLPK